MSDQTAALRLKALAVSLDQRRICFGAFELIVSADVRRVKFARSKMVVA
jgi:hypothetical protein